MKEYTSKQAQIQREPSQIYSVLSKFSNFTPMLADKVEEWQADEDTCSFKVKGMTAKLRIIEREENKIVKITGEDGTPFEFFFWIQLKQVAPYDTRMRLVLKIELNMMMKMMIGKKIQGALDQIVDQVASSFNAV
ncbi:MAG: polyketide cyclase [Rikenellaceae bacterium]